MRTQIMLSSAIALMAADAATTAPATQEAPAPPQPVEVKTINAKNAKSLAKQLWPLVEGEKHADREDNLQVLITALRDERNANKNTRVKRELPEIIKEALNKPMGELQAVKFELGGVAINFPNLIKIAEMPDSPLNQAATEFLVQQGLTVKREKKGSRGRETTTLVKGDWTKSKTFVSPEERKAGKRKDEPKAAPAS